ncbi:CotH kinase family protein [Cystobacter fuscus]
MGRWSGLLGMSVVGLLACGPGAIPATTDSVGDTLGSEPVVPTPPASSSGTGNTPPAGNAGTPGEGAPEPRAYPPVQSRIPVFELRITPENLARLEANPEAEVAVPAEVVLDGRVAPARVEYRGASTRTLPQKSFKIKLNKGYELERRDQFELLASWYDSGKLTEKFAVDLYTALGLPVPSARYVRVSLNGQHNGLYLDMEHVGKEYLEHHELEKNSAIYRCGGRNCELTLEAGSHQDDFEKKTQESEDDSDLEAFLEWINRSDDARFEENLERFVDVEAYLGNLAADMLISNIVIEDSRSYWIHEPGKDRWQYTPWDLNNAQMLAWRTWAPEDPPITNRWPQTFSLYDSLVQRVYELRVTERPVYRPTWNVLNTRIWDRPALRARLLAKLEAALAGPFSQARASAHIDALWAVVGPEMARDPYASPAHVARARDFLQRYVRERRAFLLQTLDELKKHGTGPLVIQTISAGSKGYVELYNRGTSAVSLAGYELTNDLRATVRARLPSVTLNPGQRLRLVADGKTSEGATHLPFVLSRQGGEVGLFNGNRLSSNGKPLVYGPEDVAYYGLLPSGMKYGRVTPGSEDFERQPTGS